MFDADDSRVSRICRDAGKVTREHHHLMLIDGALCWFRRRGTLQP